MKKYQVDERRESLKKSGYNLAIKCPFCEKNFDGDDIRFIRDKESNEVKYYAIPFECADCRKIFTKDNRQNRRKYLISFFAEDKYHPACIICGCDDYNQLELDHIAGDGKKERALRKNKPRRRNWEWDHKNEYQVLCRTCNRRKSDLTLETILPIYNNLLKHAKKSNRILGYKSNKTRRCKDKSNHLI